VPDLPKAKYTVWVRGYGLVDLAKVEAEANKQLKPNKNMRIGQVFYDVMPTLKTARTAFSDLA
jgi:hypothetical protein